MDDGGNDSSSKRQGWRACSTFHKGNETRNLKRRGTLGEIPLQPARKKLMLPFQNESEPTDSERINIVAKTKTIAQI